MDLGAYLAAARKKPWAWREHDCSAFVAAWAGAELPTYSNEAEAERIVRDAGGLVPLWDAALEGLAETVALADLEPGDIGVIELLAPDAKLAQAGAIWTGQRWAFVPAAGGIAAVNATAPCLKAWRPVCPRH
jgi:hypothetical protein